MNYPPPPGSQYGPPQYGPPYGEPMYPMADYAQPYPAPAGQQLTAVGFPVAPAARRSQPVVGWLMLSCGALLIIGAAMPWATVFAFSVPGTLGGGRATMFCGFIIAACGLLIGLRQGQLWVSITACVLAALVVLVALGNMGNVGRVARRSDELFVGHAVSIGSGLWLTLAAGLAALALSIVGITRRPEDR